MNEIKWATEKRPEGLEGFLGSLPLNERESIEVFDEGQPDKLVGTYWLGSHFGSGMECAARREDGSWYIL